MRFFNRGCSCNASPNLRAVSKRRVPPRSTPAIAPTSAKPWGRACWCARMLGDIRGSFASGQILWFALPLVGIGGAS